MSYTKGDIIREAFSEIGLGAFAYSQRPEDMQTALRRMGMMLAEWEADGVDLGYPLAATPNEDSIADDSEIPLDAIRAVILNLACEIAPNYGKTASRATKVGAKRAKSVLLRNSPVPARLIDYTAVPLGAGHKSTNIITMAVEEPVDGTPALLDYTPIAENLED